jgi:hypothetical protein
MPIVTGTLLDLIRRQIAAHGTVVWYDPEQAYLEAAQQLQPQDVGGAAVHRYTRERGFVWLRHELEPLWAEPLTAPRLLIYVPLARSEAEHALVEFEEGGVVMRPGQQPPECNTALDVVARQALEPVFPPARREEIVAEVEEGKLSLAELDQIAEKGSQEGAGAIGVIFGTGNPTEVALRFLAAPDLRPDLDEEIESRQALGSLGTLLSDLLGVDLPTDPPNKGTDGLRARLVRQILMTDFLEGLGEEAPESLQTFTLAEGPVARQAAVELARTWRNRRDLADSYRDWATRIESEIGLSGTSLPPEALLRTETFLAAERKLQTAMEKALRERATAALVEQARRRRGGFWSLQEPTVKTRWDVIVDAGNVLLQADRIRDALRGKTWPADALLSCYAYADEERPGEDDEPWCALDTAQRHLERDYPRFDLEPQRHDALIQLVAHARHRYTDAANDLARAFVEAYAEADFALPGVTLQADVYQETVAPAAREGRVAYLLVDALRFEMALELLKTLEETAEDWETDLTAALATPPTVTEVGMAALLPGAERGLIIEGDEKGLAPALGGEPDRVLRTRQDRVDHFVKAVEGDVTVTKLQDIAPLGDRRLREEIEGADVTLVTASEDIDGLCENNPALARRVLDQIFTQLRRGLRALFNQGVRTVVITADHGYLFGEKLTAGQTIDAPGGETVALKRRVWVGKGGAESDSTLRRPLSAFGITSDLALATPWNLSCFKARGGATEYFHGGLSLPEIVIPVLTVRSGAPPAPSAEAEIDWTLTPGSRTISTRFVSVTIKGHTTQLLPLEPPLVRVEVRADQTISTPVSASYGFRDATKDVQLKQQEGSEQAIADNTVTVRITEEPSVDQVTIYLLDATTGVTLARLDDVPFEIAL